MATIRPTTALLASSAAICSAGPDGSTTSRRQHAGDSSSSGSLWQVARDSFRRCNQCGKSRRLKIPNFGMEMVYLWVLHYRPEFAEISLECCLPNLMRSTKSTLANSNQAVISESSSMIFVIQTSRRPRVRECTKADSLEDSSSLAFLQFSKEISPQS